MSQTTVIAPVVKVLNVRCPVEDAFRVFTREISTWWPTETHAVHDGDVREVVWEEREGGEVYEVSTSGEKAHWATVTAWEPSSRFVLAWYVNPERPAPTEVEVRFSPEGETTRVELEHRHWERLAEAGADARAAYDEGWDPVLGRFAERAASVV
ncbi:MAG TPA: SRPBCC domain-containing protein [Gaiella sp.]|jgi:uncharacterized protein YndB with AHSA1/START domain